MRKNYLTAVIGLLLSLLVGCQTPTSSDMFRPGGSDQTLKASVNNAFANNPDLAAVPIHIETQKGTVFLSGYVKTIRQSDVAGYVASKVPGVKFVQNGLIVRK